MERQRSKFAVGLMMGTLGLAALATCNADDPLPFSQYESSVEQAICHTNVLCGEFPDQATCLASMQAPPHYYDTLSQDVASGKVVYDGGKARACFDKVNAVSSCNRLGPAVRLSDPTCRTIFRGTVASGGGCFFAEECAGGWCKPMDTTCVGSVQCCPGTCFTIPPPAASGSPCPSLPATCASNICVIDLNGNATCEMPVGLGASCPGDIPCASGLYCDPVTVTCKAPAGAGGACNPALESQDCDLPDVCGAPTSACTPLLAVGATCEPSTGGCVEYASCDASSRTCVMRPQVGAACDPVNGPSCLGGSCDATTTTCTLAPTAGACS